MHFLEIISADIVFKFCRYTLYILTGNGDWEWGAMTFKGASKEAKRSHTPHPSPKAPESGTISTCSSMLQENKATLFYKRWVYITC